ncbi:hypothetical protein [Glutamicibacter ardleyensis]|uniref:hypothetical protein n=1 Tax=Glutamicibacter ardleyensis TaxID=225894 RepID=UPI003FD56EE6
MIRTRDENNWSFSHHESAKAFTSAPRKSGAHSVKVTALPIDLFIEDRGSATTLVVFHSALSERVSTYPIFQGRGLAESAGLNLISVSDPSIAMGDVDLSWYLGNRSQGPLRPLLSPLIQHALDSLNTRRIVLFGASGGGYAVANFAYDFPGCIAIAVNPRLDMQARPAAVVSQYLNVCHNAKSATPMRRLRAQYVIEQVSSLANEGLNHYFLLYQNLGDTVYLNNQAMPFVKALRNDPNLFVKFDNYARGHKPIPGDTVREILDIMASELPALDAFRAAGFNTPT